MSDVLSVANSAVQTYEAALSTVSNNIANATTAGYSEEQVNIVQGTPSVEGTVVLGTGASVASVTRAYDAFASENVRNSNSELQTQNAMVNYTNQVVNALGNSTTGLTTSMDSFFSAVNQLSTSPASSTYRSTLLGSASSMASNFNQVASQLSAIDTSSQQNIASDVSDINSIATELAQVNGQLTGEPSESAQPPALLDQRDSLLSQLSKYATVTTSFSNNGAVTVSIGGSLSSGVIVNGTSTTLVTQTANSENPPVISLGLSANGTTQPLTGLSGGDLSGLLTFRSQVLSPAFGQINLLANTLATQVNQTQAQGIDLDGNAGQALFTTSDSGTGAAANLQVAITNPNLIAAASPFDVSASENNPGTETASVSYQAPTSSGPGTLSQVLGNNADPAAGVAVNVSNDESPAAVTTIPAGTQNAVIYLDNPGSNQQLQILTQNGVQVTGSALTSTQQSNLLTTGQGFASGTTYNNQYLNTGYDGMAVFYGAQASAQGTQTFQADGMPGTPTLVPAQLTSSGISSTLNSGSIAAGAFTLNGVALPALTDPSGGNITPADVVTWLNSAGVSGVTASVDGAGQVQLTSANTSTPIQLGFGSGAQAGTPAQLAALGFRTAAYLSGTVSTNLVVAVSGAGEGASVAASYNGAATDPVTALRDNPSTVSFFDTAQSSGPLPASGLNGGNAFVLDVTSGSPATTTPVSVAANEDTPQGVAAAINAAGLGVNATVSATGDASKPYQITLTSTVTAPASPSAFSVSLDAANPTLSGGSLNFNGVSGAALGYVITDNGTGTNLAAGTIPGGQTSPSISYNGLTLQFTGMPVGGDSFGISGDQGGSGNNQNALSMASLASANLVNGNQTLDSAYTTYVNDVGNTASQATIAQTALTVVNNQATTTQSSVSGVSLDTEASNLIKYQQAYEAAAKVIQTASQLFSDIYGITSA